MSFANCIFRIIFRKLYVLNILVLLLFSSSILAIEEKQNFDYLEFLGLKDSLEISATNYSHYTNEGKTNGTAIGIGDKYSLVNKIYLILTDGVEAGIIPRNIDFLKRKVFGSEESIHGSINFLGLSYREKNLIGMTDIKTLNYFDGMIASGINKIFYFEIRPFTFDMSSYKYDDPEIKKLLEKLNRRMIDKWESKYLGQSMLVKFDNETFFLTVYASSEESFKIPIDKDDRSQAKMIHKKQEISGGGRFPLFDKMISISGGLKKESYSIEGRVDSLDNKEHYFNNSKEKISEFIRLSVKF